MTNTRRKTRQTTARAATALSVLAAIAAPGVANADTSAEEHPSILKHSGFGLSVVDHADPAKVRTAALSCDPDGGTHANPDAACDALEEAGGSFGELAQPDSPTMCPLIYKPVTVHASGVWKGQPVEFHQTYSNSCVLQAETGPVFQF